MRALLKLKRFIDCLDVSDLKWLNPYAIRISFQDGKSIFNTDYTESYNQHWSEDYVNLPFLESFYYNYLYVRKAVPLEIGFVSHFRDTSLKKANYLIKFKDLIIDMDTFYYFINFRIEFKLKASCFEKCLH